MLAGMGESQNGAAEQNQNGDGAANHGMLDERMSETTNLISNDFQVEVSSFTCHSPTRCEIQWSRADATR